MVRVTHQGTGIFEDRKEGLRVAIVYDTQMFLKNTGHIHTSTERDSVSRKAVEEKNIDKYNRKGRGEIADRIYEEIVK